ncbi:MAG TPA: hypothetical protein VMC81_00575 [Rhodocyclaceae bacterium]|nr:hypothetical protein [Rhodocyclaceae bacterium]
MRATLAIVLLTLLAACGGGGGSGTTTGSSSGSPSSGMLGSGSGSSGASSSGSGSGTSSGSTSGSSSGASTCSTGFLGRNHLLVGASMEDATAAAAPFDARYLYLAGGIPPVAACVSSCNAAANCGNWWGCWQDFSKAPGLYATDFVAKGTAAKWQGAARPQVPMFTYYEILQSSGVAEGVAEVSALNNAAFLTRYFDDWRFLLQKIGNAQVMLHIEPDFWGYVRQANANPHALPAPVASANATDCAGQENSVAGFSRCMIAMVRKYAPNAAVGLHASDWLMPYITNDGQVLGNFLVELGAGDSDFVGTDASDRDAGYYQSLGRDTWWTDADAQQFLAWSKLVADTVGKPTVLWQIPVGNMAQNNTTKHWQDNRVDYLFAHLVDVVKSGIVALMFGAGESQQTTPETDGGNLVAKTTANWQAGGTSLCQ